jgi:2-amino-4-hydroxy-6-hydroxymethyldihydropteridine diphosphokinase
MLKTTLGPRALLNFCQSLETEEGRKRKERWGARTLDIDLLFYAQQQINETRIEVPHPRLTERHFVLLPLVALAPDFCHPLTGLSMRDLLNELPAAKDIRILNQNW